MTSSELHCQKKQTNKKPHKLSYNDPHLYFKPNPNTLQYIHTPMHTHEDTLLQWEIHIHFNFLRYTTDILSSPQWLELDKCIGYISHYNIYADYTKILTWFSFISFDQYLSVLRTIWNQTWIRRQFKVHRL